MFWVTIGIGVAVFVFGSWLCYRMLPENLRKRMKNQLPWRRG